jgi:hypothetical protein
MFLTLFSSVVVAQSGTPISFTKRSPEDVGATKVYSKLTDKINVIFGEAVKAGSGYVRLSDANGPVRVIAATDSRISYAKGDTVVIDFSADQKELVTYSVSVDNGTFVRAGTTAGQANVTSWDYTVGDYTAPVLSAVEPVKDASVGQLTSLKMTFTDASAVLKGTGKVALYKADGNIWDLIDIATKGAVTGTGTTGDPYILSVSPVRALEDNVNYTVTISAGAVTDNGLRADEKKNSYGGLTDRGVFKFSSKDFTVPGYATDYPKAGTIGVTSFDLLVKTTETGSFYAKEFTSAQTKDATLLSALTGTTAVTATSGVEAKKTFNSGIIKNTKYFVYVVTKNGDVAATVSDIVGPIEITTIDTDKPLLTNVTYSKGTSYSLTQAVTGTTAIDQSVTTIKFNFNETVKVGAGSILIYKKSDNSVFMTVDAAAIKIDADHDNIAIATLPKVFENHAEYYAFIPSTLFKDVYNNFYTGITTTTGWTFSTDDTVAPTIVSYTPVDGAVSVKNSDNIVVKFSEIIDLGSAGSTFPWFTLYVNGTPVNYAWSHSTNNNVFSTVTIDPAADFESSSVVTLTVSGDIDDLAGNTLGLSQGISFIAKDIVGPTMTWKTATPIAPSASIVVEYNEPVRLLGGTEITAANLYTIVTLKKDNADGINVSATYAINADKTQITITPASPWDSKGVYYVAMSSDVEDLLGNKCIDAVATRNKTYVVNDVVPATVSINVDGKTDVDVAGDIYISFKEGSSSTQDPISKLYYGGVWNDYTLAGMSNVIVLKENDANGVNIIPSSITLDANGFKVVAPLAGAKTYYIGIGASTKDAGGNVNAAKYATFTTKFVAAPEVVTLDPADDKIEVALKAPVTIAFNTDIALVASGSYANGVTINGNPVLYTDLSVSGKVLTIKHADFNKNTAYNVQIASGVVTNKASGVAFGGITTTTDWNFVTVDQTFDAFTLSPDGGVTPELGDKLVISIPTEKIISGTGNIAIKNADTDLLIEQISSTSNKVAISYSGSATTIEITPSAKFVYGANYYVEVDNGAFVDAYGNKIPPIHGKTTDGAGVGSWTFTAVNSALAVTKVTPNMVENVAVDADIVVTFNRDIVKGTSGNVGFVEYGFDETTLKQTVNYGITSSNLIVSGNTLTIKHADKPFTANSTIFVTLESGAIKAASLNSTTALAKADSPAHKFFVGDNLPPVATVVPTWDAEAKNYSQVNTNITITFNEDVLNAGTNLALTNDNVTFHAVAGQDVIQLLDQDLNRVDFQGTVSGRTITIDPTSNLAESKTYTVRIVGGTIKDTHSHAIASDFDKQFKTVDTTLPTVSATLTSGAKLVNVTAISVTDANPQSFYYILKKESDGAITASADVKASGKKLDATGGTIANFQITGLEAATSYVLYYVAEDTFGNLTAVKTSKVSTTDTVAPVLVSTDPVNGTLDVDNAKKIVLTFNEDVAVSTTSTAKIYIKDKATNAIILTLDKAALAVSGSSAKKVELTTGFPALAAVQVYVEIEAGLIQDRATSPNDFAGILGSDKLYYTYEDNLAPSVTKFAYTGDDINHVALNSNLVFTFSEDVQAGSASAILYKSGSPIEVFKGSEVAISGNTVTINPTVDFANTSSYTIALAAGFVQDKSSIKNASVAYVNGSAFAFTTDVNVAPTVAANPVEFTKGNKNLLTDIELTFTEDVYLTIAGLKKSLLALTVADIKAQLSLKTADGIAVPYSVSSTNSNFISLAVNIDDLKDLTSYVLTVGGFKDIDGVVMETKTFKYTTGDGKAPTFIFNPANDAKNVVASSVLTITFSEPIFRQADVTTPGDAALFYKPFTNDNVDEILSLVDWTLGEPVAFDGTFNGTDKFTLTPAKPLISGHVYRYGFSGVVTDINGNAVVGDFGGAPALKMKSASILAAPLTYAEFTVLDTEKPTFVLNDTMVKPKPAATSVAATEEVWIDFNEAIVVGTGSITIRYEDGTIFQTINGSALSVKSDDDSKLLIAHKNFDSNAVYFVEIGEGVVTDKAGNKNIAMTDPTKWTFTTKDTFELTAKVTPTGENTARTVSLTLSFNKAPEAQSNKFLAVYKQDGTAVYQKAVSEMSVVGKDAIYAGVVLDANQAYYARVEPNAFVDGSGNKFAGIMDNSWEFSTVNNIAPKVVTLAPKDDATGLDPVTSTFTMTFDRNIAIGTGVISVRYGVDGKVFEDVNVSAATVDGMTLTFKVSKPLDANTAYYVLVPAGGVTNTEVTKDAYAGISNVYTWNFTTSTDQTAPKLVTWTPNATTITDNHPTLVMTFDENVVLGAGNVKVVKASDNTTALTIPVTAAMVSGKTVTVTYTYDATLKNGLDKNTDYYVLVDAGVVKDAAANAAAGVTATTTWTFKTGATFVTDTDPVIDNSLEFKVYPNPFVDYVIVDNASELTKIVVTNIAGQVVKEVVTPDSKIQLNELRSGVYFISLYQGNTVAKTVKIAKR